MNRPPLARLKLPVALVLAALLLSMLPWDVVYATRGYPDLPAAALFSIFEPFITFIYV